MYRMNLSQLFEFWDWPNTFPGPRHGRPGRKCRRHTKTKQEPKPEPKPKPEPEPKIESLLKVKRIDLHKDDNRKRHHTKKYDLENLIVRRGQRIELTVFFDREPDPEHDQVTFELWTGDSPRQAKGTKVILHPQKEKLDRHNWELRMLKKRIDTTGVRFNLMPAADCGVGIWHLAVKTAYDNEDTDSTRMERTVFDEDIYILFNGWSPADQCFMGTDDDARSDDGSDWGDDDGQPGSDDNSTGSEAGSEDEDDYKPRKPDHTKLYEYVVNQGGLIYRGSYKNMRGKPWFFGQFEPVSLQAALYCLDEAELQPEARGNVTLVTRALSKMVNSNDGSGILEGRWARDYPGGTRPTKWNGSIGILEEFMENKASVKYGQCWVFSGVLTTVSRALGIPCRSVTNFASAHDTDVSMTIDKHVDADLKKIAHLDDDSIWNFHVWNEGYFRRPDLPDGYDGWQAYDSTPQELSEGIMQCGPAPLKAIKNGDVYIGYDSKFLYGEVNGDVVTWKVKSDPSDPEQSYYDGIEKVDKAAVGRNTSTKIVGKPKTRRWETLGSRGYSDKARKDVTHLYKHREGSAEAEEANTKATRLGSKKGILEHYRKKKEGELEPDVNFNFEAANSTDGDMSATLTIENTSGEARTVHVQISVHALYYTGEAGEELMEDNETVEVPAGAVKEHTASMKAVDYINKMDADACVDFYCRAKVEKTGQRYVSNDETVMIDMPDLDMELSKGSPSVGEAFKVKIKFKNPLNVPMTDLSMTLEGPGIHKSMKVQLPRKKIAPDEEIEVTVELTARRKGKEEIIAGLSSRQVNSVTGIALINVKK